MYELQCSKRQTYKNGFRACLTSFNRDFLFILNGNAFIGGVSISLFLSLNVLFLGQSTQSEEWAQWRHRTVDFHPRHAHLQAMAFKLPKVSSQLYHYDLPNSRECVVFESIRVVSASLYESIVVRLLHYKPSWYHQIHVKIQASRSSHEACVARVTHLCSLATRSMYLFIVVSPKWCRIPENCHFFVV